MVASSEACAQWLHVFHVVLRPRGPPAMSPLMTWTPLRFMLVGIAGRPDRQQEDAIRQDAR
jgi:hypothetical protein